MSSATDSVERGVDACELCGDVAAAGTVLSIDAGARTAIVALECGTATVALDLVEARVGDTLLVHLGFAITRLEVA
jgi:hydrogenase maturation factor